jgi:hypothetical protein
MSGAVLGRKAVRDIALSGEGAIFWPRIVSLWYHNLSPDASEVALLGVLRGEKRKAAIPKESGRIQKTCSNSFVPAPVF